MGRGRGSKEVAMQEPIGFRQRLRHRFNEQTPSRMPEGLPQSIKAALEEEKEFLEFISSSIKEFETEEGYRKNFEDAINRIVEKTGRASEYLEDRPIEALWMIASVKMEISSITRFSSLDPTVESLCKNFAINQKEFMDSIRHWYQGVVFDSDSWTLTAYYRNLVTNELLRYPKNSVQQVVGYALKKFKVNMNTVGLKDELTSVLRHQNDLEMAYYTLASADYRSTRLAQKRVDKRLPGLREYTTIKGRSPSAAVVVINPGTPEGEKMKAEGTLGYVRKTKALKGITFLREDRITDRLIVHELIHQTQDFDNPPSDSFLSETMAIDMMEAVTEDLAGTIAKENKLEGAGYYTSARQKFNSIAKILYAQGVDKKEFLETMSCLDYGDREDYLTEALFGGTGHWDRAKLIRMVEAANSIMTQEDKWFGKTKKNRDSMSKNPIKRYKHLVELQRLSQKQMDADILNYYNRLKDGDSRYENLPAFKPLYDYSPT